jgi:hypothetical protein
MFTECTLISTLGLSLSRAVLHSLNGLGEGTPTHGERKKKTSDSFKIEDRKRKTEVLDTKL